MEKAQKNKMVDNESSVTTKVVEEENTQTPVEQSEVPQTVTIDTGHGRKVG